MAIFTMNWFEQLGRGTNSAVSQVGEVSILFGQTLRFSLTPPWRRKNIFEQMVNIGVLSLPIVVVTGGFTGMVLAIQSYYYLRKLSIETGIGALLTLSVIREIGPVMTGLMLAGRVGASMAAELGTMKVTEQIDALKTLAINPIRHLVVPRFLSCIILLPILTIFTDFIAILGGYLVGVKLMGIYSVFYISHTQELVEATNVITGLFKSVFFGGIIAIVGCYKGLTAEKGAEGVGKTTTGAVVTSCLLILVVNFFLAIIIKSLGF